MELQRFVCGSRRNWRSDREMGYIYGMLHTNPYYVSYMFLRALELNFFSCVPFG